MKGKLMVLAGAAVGYVFGTRAGRERYEQIKGGFKKAWEDPRVQDKVNEAERLVSDTAKNTVPQVQEKITDTARSAVDAAKAKFGGDHDEKEGTITSDGAPYSSPN